MKFVFSVLFFLGGSRDLEIEKQGSFYFIGFLQLYFQENNIYTFPGAMEPKITKHIYRYVYAGTLWP